MFKGSKYLNNIYKNESIYCFELVFYGPLNTVKVISSRSVNLLTLFLEMLNPLSG